MFPFWFACNTCRGSFQKLHEFLEHKQQDHCDEFQNTKCIIFEERRISNNEQTVSYSPTPQEIGEAYPQEYINPQNVKVEGESENNFDERTNFEFQDDTDFNSSKPGIVLNSDFEFKPTLEDTSYISQNSSVTNGSCLNKDLCKNSTADFDCENKPNASLHSNLSALNSQDLGPTHILIECQQNPFVLIRRLNSQEIQNRYASNSEKYPKPNCEKTSKKKVNFPHHKRNVQSKTGPCKRPQVNCSKKPTAKSSIPKLLPTHSTSGPFKCPISSCPQTFKNRGSIRLHMVQHTGIRQFKCTQIDCRKTFQLRHHLAEHITTHSDARPFKCPKASCNKTFKHVNGIRHHMKVHFNLPLKKCPDCKKTFKWKQSLRQHLLTHQDRKLIKCPGVETDGDTNANLQGTQSAIKIDTRSFKCQHPNCGKTFQWKYRLNRHISTHSDARHAKSKLSRINDFETHNQITEDASSNGTTQDQEALSPDLLSFKCNKLHCGKHFSNKFNLTRHFLTVHSDERPFKCSVSTCDYTCKQKSDLKKHLLTKKHTYIQN